MCQYRQNTYLENQDHRDACEKQNREDKVGAGEDGQGELIKAVADATHDSGDKMSTS